jgi:hypothetical protein
MGSRLTRAYTQPRGALTEGVIPKLLSRVTLIDQKIIFQLSVDLTLFDLALCSYPQPKHQEQLRKERELAEVLLISLAATVSS